MSWSGDGSFNRTDGVRTGATTWQQAAAANENIRADHADVHDEDLATGLEACLTRNGENSPTANLPMNAKKHTGVADATANNQYAAWGQVKTRIAAPIAFTAVLRASVFDWDLSAAARGTLEMTGDIPDFTVSNGSDGGVYIMRFEQDATGGRSITFPAAWVWPSGEVPELTQDAGAVDILTIMRIGAAYIAVLGQDFSA